ncbi:FAD-dependent monooxygenase [Xylophilus sp.]|uniref:FAD-dependent monooxygenase n=1 Tax=Xylophilus sp. TaxID=2653893 RepID=UPI0013B65FEF|nr:FAD-dependent monooxygenase [Xylophilus sp.]KAF1043817.1 MAG: 3-hydroxybenzoate 6-hydroxylase 1 [Xylophilus sp.]
MSSNHGKEAIIAGGGIGGLAAALACGRAGWTARLFERAAAFGEVGAGVQLGPNVTRLLEAWGLGAELRRRAAFPARAQTRSTLGGAVLATLPLGDDMVRRYGAPYAAIHRADLHGLLLDAVRAAGSTELHLDTAVTAQVALASGVVVTTGRGREVEADALVAADGVWSALRQQLLGDGPPRTTGHVAYRGIAAQAQLPQALRSTQVTVWLAPRLHVVAYPVRGGELLNVVAIAAGRVAGSVEHWDHAATDADLQQALAGTSAPLRDLAAAIGRHGQWRLWALADRPPVRGPDDMARGPVALLGDAAHPMRPYLAQGAGMAIEDAAELERSLGLVQPDLEGVVDVPLALRRYALNRWQRVARVQARSVRNGRIFHAGGPLRWGRDAALRLLGPRLMDQPWLYGFG